MVLEKTLESPLDCKEIQPAHPKGNQFWVFIGRTDAKAETPILWPLDAKKLTRWKRPWCRERLKVGGKGDNRGWDGWMASPTQWTLVWVSSGSWWWTGKPGVLQSMGSQRAGMTERLNWTELNCLLEKLRDCLQEQSDGNIHLAYYRPSKGYLVLNSIHSLALCQQHIRNSDMFHKISEIKKIELTSEI